MTPPDYYSPLQIGDITRWQVLYRWLQLHSPRLGLGDQNNGNFYWYGYGGIPGIKFFNARDWSSATNAWGPYYYIYTLPGGKVYKWSNLVNVPLGAGFISDMGFYFPDFYDHHDWLVKSLASVIPGTADFFYGMDVDEQMGFTAPPDGNFALNFAHRNEKWFKFTDEVTRVSTWAYIEPSGAVYRTTAKSTQLPGKAFLMKLPAARYQSLSTLVKTQELRMKSDFPVDLASSTGCTLSNNYCQNSLGANLKERWFRMNVPKSSPTSNITETVKQWYFIRPNGDVYKWSGILGGLTDTYVTTLGVDVYNNLEPLFINLVP